MKTSDYEKMRVEIARGIRTLPREALEQTLDTMLENIYPEGDEQVWTGEPASTVARALESMRVKSTSKVVAEAGTFVRFNGQTVFAATVIGGQPLPKGTYEFDGSTWSFVEPTPEQITLEAAPTNKKKPRSDLPEFRVGDVVFGSWDPDQTPYTINHITRDRRGTPWKYNMVCDKDVGYIKTNVLEENLFLPTDTMQRTEFESDPAEAYSPGRDFHVGSPKGQIYRMVRVDMPIGGRLMYLMEEQATGMAMSVTPDGLHPLVKKK